jgi:L-2,4-diaminobutyrate decarboxylase
MHTAEHLARLVAGHPHLELWAPPVTGVVNWRPADRDPAAVRDRLTGAWVSLADIDGRLWFRSVAANPLADPAHVIARITAAL